MNLTPEQYEILFGEPPRDEGNDPSVPAAPRKNSRKQVAPSAKPSSRRRVSVRSEEHHERFTIRDTSLGPPSDGIDNQEVPTLLAFAIPRPVTQRPPETKDETVRSASPQRKPLLVAGLLFGLLILSPLVLLLLDEDPPEPEVLSEAVVAVEPSTPSTTEANTLEATGSSPIPSAFFDSALQSLDTAITVAPTPAPIGFERSLYLDEGWPDSDGDCQSDLHEVLIEESTVDATLDIDGCRVVGGLWVDPFDDGEYVDPSELVVDHLVPLEVAHSAGAWEWDESMKRAFATDINFEPSLVVVSERVSQARNAQSPDVWRPSEEGAWCQYAIDWIAVKTRWTLTYETAEVAALESMLETCSPQ